MKKSLLSVSKGNANLTKWWAVQRFARVPFILNPRFSDHECNLMTIDLE